MELVTVQCFDELVSQLTAYVATSNKINSQEFIAGHNSPTINITFILEDEVCSAVELY